MPLIDTLKARAEFEAVRARNNGDTFMIIWREDGTSAHEQGLLAVVKGDGFNLDHLGMCHAYQEENAE
eukprot:2449731-Amphidinium_carterae.1